MFYAILQCDLTPTLESELAYLRLPLARIFFFFHPNTDMRNGWVEEKEGSYYSHSS